MQAPKFWQYPSWQSYLLRPLSGLFNLLAAHKKRKVNTLNAEKLPVPIIIVGNINVGGTGKTPVCIEIIRLLQAQGYQPALISRGYGRKTKALLHANPQSDELDHNFFTPENFGDEPYLIAKNTLIPVAVGAKRREAAKILLEKYPQTNIIISDDGLQHYALARDLEIAVVGHYGFGNGLTLPSGPLREPVERLNDVDFILYQQTQHQLNKLSKPQFVLNRYIKHAYELNQPSNIKPLSDFSLNNLNLNNINERPHIKMLAGIAYPDIFFEMLESFGIEGSKQAFKDHHQFTGNDFSSGPHQNSNEIILMTEKDAVKCKHLNLKNVWVVPLLLELPNEFKQAFLQALENLNKT